MSHFTVLVIGENPEKQLEPYWELDLSIEEIKKDSRAKFSIEIEQKDLQKKFEEWGKKYKEDVKNRKKNYVDENAEQWVREWYCHYYSKEHDAWGYWVNPNAKWDWYTLGGRWAGFFLLKDGTKTDQAYMRDIDWEEMRDEKNRKSDNTFKEIMNKVRELSRFESKSDEEIVSFLKEAKEIKETRAREIFEEKEKNLFDSLYWEYNYHFGDSMEENRKRYSLATFAVLKEGEWFEKGKMGWWACVSDEKEVDVWKKEWNDLISNIPGDTLLSLYDCHI
ncbi:MAG: hypothetical protein WC309_03245 [Candidatus Paceibacterota bacterium]|jgi:predicted transcriptional regulator